MKQVEIFKTGVCKASEAEAVTNILLKCFPQYQINFDLDDCDNILRVESQQDLIDEKQVRQTMAELGYECFWL